MRELKFSINGQKLSKAGDMSHIIRGSKGYLNCSFTFESEDWIGYKVAAVFELQDEEYAIPVNSSGECLVPDEVTDSSYFKLRLVGKKNDSVLTTSRILISQEG